MHDYIRCQVKVVNVTSSQSFELKKAPSLCRTSKNNILIRALKIKKIVEKKFFCWSSGEIEIALIGTTNARVACSFVFTRSLSN